MSDFKLVKLLGDPIQITLNIIPRGVYNPSIQYNLGDSVSYGNSSYVALAPTLGNIPTNTSFWQLLAQGSGITPGSITDVDVDKISPYKIEDAQNKTYEDSILTTNNVATTIVSVDCSIDSCILMESKIVARRIDGLAGNIGDSATFIRTFRVKSAGGIVTICDLQSDYTSKDNSNVNISIQALGTAVVIKVIGDTDNNIKWISNLITSIDI